MRYLFLLLVLTSCVPKANKCSQFVHNIYGESITWKKPTTLNISNEVPREFVPSIYRAANTWNKIIGRNQIVITEAASGDNNILYLSSWEADRTSEQGRTSVRWGGNEIKSADIKINSKNFTFYDVAPVPNGNQYSFEALMLHEMGHFLGLGHTDNQGSVMSPTLGAYDDRVNPSAEDIKQVQCEYK